MSRECEICGKKRMLGNNVSHANNRNRREFRPNLVTVRAKVNGAAKRIKICTRCLRSGRIVKAWYKRLFELNAVLFALNKVRSTAFFIHLIHEECCGYKLILKVRRTMIPNQARCGATQWKRIGEWRIRLP